MYVSIFNPNSCNIMLYGLSESITFVINPVLSPVFENLLEALVGIPSCLCTLAVANAARFDSASDNPFD